MMYIFPRQFGLHNVFTNEVDSRQTVQPFKDYTLREDEISKKYPLPIIPKIPKRLRGRAMELVGKLQIRHRRCSYKELLERYCSVSVCVPSRCTLTDALGNQQIIIQRNFEVASPEQPSGVDRIQNANIQKSKL
jgi:hypothetical protein